MWQRTQERDGEENRSEETHKRKITVIFVKGKNDVRLQSKQMHKDVKEVSNLESCRCGKEMRGHVKSLMQV